MNEDFHGIGGHLRPSQWALKRASQLGAAMAATEPRIAPVLRMAAGYVSYVQFLYVHRRRLEQLRVFEPWEAHLQRLIEREQEMLGFELLERPQWEEFYASIGEPMRCSFWHGWEVAVDLYAQYQRELAQVAQQAKRVQTIEMADDVTAPERAGEPASHADDETTQWTRLADNAFGAIREVSSAGANAAPSAVGVKG